MINPTTIHELENAYKHLNLASHELSTCPAIDLDLNVRLNAIRREIYNILETQREGEDA